MRTKLLTAALLLAAVAPAPAADEGLTKGTPNLKSATALAFGPNGILFVGDSAATTVYAIDTGDTKPAGDKAVNVERIDGQIAAKLELYRMERDAWPTPEEGLSALTDGQATPTSSYYLSRDQLTDPWGHIFQLIIPGPEGHPYEIISLGADGQPGGEGENADITSIALRR